MNYYTRNWSPKLLASKKPTDWFAGDKLPVEPPTTWSVAFHRQLFSPENLGRISFVTL